MHTGRYDDYGSVYGDLGMTMTSDGRAGDGRNRRRDAALGGSRAALRMRDGDSGSVMAENKNGAAGLPPAAAVAPLPEHLSRCLRAMYDDVLDEPVPDRFRQL